MTIKTFSLGGDLTINRLGFGAMRDPLDTERLGKVAARLGATTAQVQIASLLAASPSMLVIPGTGSLDHLEENLAAADLVLGEEDLSALRG
ncbi:aldo/keto reductase [Streptomyces sp. NPDC088731]|uniref:aldo/keto reductase n=1 Tax=Streptomyces sp. NPDC088731 TaxID=3365878 RepID=UPI0037F5D05A